MENITENRINQNSSLTTHHLFSIETILLIWFVTTPVASFFIRYPSEKSIITYDRAVFFIVVAMLLWEYRARAKTASIRVSALPFEVAWALLSLLMLINVAVKSGDAGHAIKIVFDAFWLPLAAFHIARRHFDLRGKASALLLGAVALGVMLFAIGAYEFMTGTDLFHYKGSELIREGELRVNGPFASDSSHAILCLLIAVFLAFAPRVLNVKLDRAARLVYGFALAASVVASMLPRYRVVAATMIVCWLIFAATSGTETGWVRKVESVWRTRRLSLSSLRLHPFTMTVMVLIALVALSALVASASLGRRLASAYNAYGRLATWEAATRIAAENPLLGVGITNYKDYFRAKYFEGERPVESIIEARAALSPHSNPLWVAAEVGALAFALYVIANVYIFRMGYRALKRAENKRQLATGSCFLALAVAYFLPGLTLTSGIYADLNLYFFFLLGLLANRFLVTVSTNA